MTRGGVTSRTLFDNRSLIDNWFVPLIAPSLSLTSELDVQVPCSPCTRRPCRWCHTSRNVSGRRGHGGASGLEICLEYLRNRRLSLWEVRPTSASRLQEEQAAPRFDRTGRHQGVGTAPKLLHVAPFRRAQPVPTPPAHVPPRGILAVLYHIQPPTIVVD